MEPENIKEEAVEVSRLHTITPISKYLAMALFIILPFIGGWIGYAYAPLKVVEVERVVVKEVFVAQPVTDTSSVNEIDQCVEDSDCVLVQPDCEDCEFAAISTNGLKDFRAEKQNRCELNPSEIMCDLVFNGEVKCVDNYCQLVQ